MNLLVYGVDLPVSRIGSCCGFLSPSVRLLGDVATGKERLSPADTDSLSLRAEADVTDSAEIAVSCVGCADNMLAALATTGAIPSPLRTSRAGIIK